MTSAPRFSTATAYLGARIERDLATIQRRAALVAADELARMGELAFAGPDGDVLQAAVDLLAQRAILDALGIKADDDPAVALEMSVQLDRGLLAAGLPVELLRPMRRCADAHATLMVTREAKVNGNRAASVDTRDVREIVKHEVAAFHRTMHRGAWKEGEQYEQGQMVTRQGSTWSCLRDGAHGKPGESSDFLLIVKRGNDGGR